MKPANVTEAVVEAVRRYLTGDPEPADELDLALALEAYDAAEAVTVPVAEAREWSHGCDALCQNVTLWAPCCEACPHCGRPAPKATESEAGGSDG